jgi:hypothetical protein
MLTKLRQILYRQQPKSADLLIGTISILFAWSAFLTRNVTPQGPAVQALDRVAPIIFWITLLFAYGVIICLSTIFNKPFGVLVGSGLGTFTWGAICGVLLFNLPLNPLLLLGISIYIVFFIFNAWSFINAQEVYRLSKKFGPNYQRVLEETTLKELIDLRERVVKATNEPTSQYTLDKNGSAYVE